MVTYMYFAKAYAYIYIYICICMYIYIYIYISIYLSILRVHVESRGSLQAEAPTPTYSSDRAAKASRLACARNTQARMAREALRMRVFGSVKDLGVRASFEVSS